jgi:hypothetical protein
MSFESQKPLVFFLPPDLRAQPRKPEGQELSDTAYSGFGRMLLGYNRLSTIKNPCFEELYAPPASLEDWECLEAEEPDLYHTLSGKVLTELARQDIDAPFIPVLAVVHSLDEIRARRQAVETAGNNPAAHSDSSRPAVS